MRTGPLLEINRFLFKSGWDEITFRSKADPHENPLKEILTIDLKRDCRDGKYKALRYTCRVHLRDFNTAMELEQKMFDNLPHAKAIPYEKDDSDATDENRSGVL